MHHVEPAETSSRKAHFLSGDIVFISSRLYKSFAFETLNRIAHLSGPCRYFFHHSTKVERVKP